LPWQTLIIHYDDSHDAPATVTSTTSGFILQHVNQYYLLDYCHTHSAPHLEEPA